MRSSAWSDQDVALAEAIFARRFPRGRGMEQWTRAVDGERDWRGEEDGLRSIDTRHPIKNHEEYKGMELFAWQFMTTAQYEEASDHFYAAALWRENDREEITRDNPGHQSDSGHIKAIDLCLRMARFSRALWRSQAAGNPCPQASEFGLEEAWVSAKENEQTRRIRRAVPELPEQ